MGKVRGEVNILSVLLVKSELKLKFECFIGKVRDEVNI